MTYKQATIGLGVALGVTYLVFIIVYIVYLREQVKRGEQVSAAIVYAGDNRAVCKSSAVSCCFTPHLDTPPPMASSETTAAATTTPATPSATVTKPGATLPFAQPAARYGAQLIGLLQDAAIEQRPPVVMPSTKVVSVLSGVNVKTKSRGGRNQGIGWILEVLPESLPAGSRKQLWIAFRGTQTREEWKVDFTFHQMPLDAEDAADIKVHEGFYLSYLELAPAIRNYVKTLITPDTTLYITGHSLGAALAILCTADLCLLSAQLGITDIRLYGFAAPRVGNAAFVNMVLGLLGTSSLREFYLICNDADIVPAVPPAVTPNLMDPSKPLLYDHFPMLHFNENWGSWMLNHILPVYIENLGKLNILCDINTGAPPAPAAMSGAIKPRPHLAASFSQRNQWAELRRRKNGKQQDDERSQLLRKLLFGF